MANKHVKKVLNITTHEGHESQNQNVVLLYMIQLTINKKMQKVANVGG